MAASEVISKAQGFASGLASSTISSVNSTVSASQIQFVPEEEDFDAEKLNRELGELLQNNVERAQNAILPETKKPEEQKNAEAESENQKEDISDVSNEALEDFNLEKSDDPEPISKEEDSEERESVEKEDSSDSPFPPSASETNENSNLVSKYKSENDNVKKVLRKILVKKRVQEEIAREPDLMSEVYEILFSLSGMNIK